MLPNVIAAISGAGVVVIDGNGNSDIIYEAPGQRLYGVDYDYRRGHYFVAHSDRIVSFDGSGQSVQVFPVLDDADLHGLVFSNRRLYVASAKHDVIYQTPVDVETPGFGHWRQEVVLDEYFDRPSHVELCGHDWSHTNFVYIDRRYRYIYFTCFRHPEFFTHGVKGGMFAVVDRYNGNAHFYEGDEDGPIDRPHAIVPFRGGALLANTGVAQVNFIPNDLSEDLDDIETKDTGPFDVLVEYDKGTADNIKHIVGPHHIEVYMDDYFAVSIPNAGVIELRDKDGAKMGEWRIPFWSGDPGKDPRCYQFKLMSMVG
jgi:hypothetical protein